MIQHATVRPRRRHTIGKNITKTASYKCRQLVGFIWKTKTRKGGELKVSKIIVLKDTDTHTHTHTHTQRERERERERSVQFTVMAP